MMLREMNNLGLGNRENIHRSFIKLCFQKVAFAVTCFRNQLSGLFFLPEAVWAVNFLVLCLHTMPDTMSTSNHGVQEHLPLRSSCVMW